MIGEALYMSRSEEWGTPQKLFDKLDAEFHFGLDVCATPQNAKCKNFFTKADDGLSKKWGGYGSVWCNPPYGRKIYEWVQKAYESSAETTVVMLIPARTDTKWFHDYVYGKSEIRFIKGRLKYGNAKYNAPFPSMIVIYRKRD